MTDANPIGPAPCKHCGCPYAPWSEVHWVGEELRSYAECRHCHAMTADVDKHADALAAWSRGETTIPEGAESVPRWR